MAIKMGKERTANERRKYMIELMREAGQPLSGARLGTKTGVSRQVVVQDIALLRREGYDIISTARGYYLAAKDNGGVSRIIKVYHTNEQVEEELTTIVDLGGCVVDVMVNHRVYGKVTAPLMVKNRRDVRKFMENLKNGKSTPLLNITSGYHFHTVTAESEEILDEIVAALQQKNYLADLLPYEKE